MNQSSVKKYLIPTFVLAWILQIVATFSLHGQHGPILFQLCLVLCMYAPFVGALFAGKTLRGMGWKLHRSHLSALFCAWLIPLILTLLGAVIYFFLFPSHFDFSGKSVLTQYAQLSLKQQHSLTQNWSHIVLTQLLLGIFFAPLINIFSALGEEVGWRGFLYPQLKQRYGTGKGRIIGGIIWGIWHWPIMILAGYNYGTAYFGAPFLGPVVFCLVTVVFGILFDYLYTKSRLIFVPALAHGAINAFASLPSLFYNPQFAPYKIFGPFPMGIISCLPFVLFAVILSKRTSLIHNSNH